ncbi:YaaR family protein [Bacillus sp. PDNC022]|uniref:YaaR family protein n=1 Tax=Bacillus sp. PDNC022 TaxID=2812759 RepID=UPI0019657C92|nr:YaaR family protein [Bacillus sp. PDNC022]QRY36462.1 YaaR family protein [Bacillus sp. PDNC022]
MKINQDMRLRLEKRELQAMKGNQTSASFKASMETQSGKLRLEQLTVMLSDIEVFGKKLAKSRNLKDLARFKGLVKRFVKETVDNGLNIETSRSFDIYGNTRTLALIKALDEKLIELTEDMMNQEKPSIDLLERIGEIKGLLINLYT